MEQQLKPLFKTIVEDQGANFYGDNFPAIDDTATKIVEQQRRDALESLSKSDFRNGSRTSDPQKVNVFGIPAKISSFQNPNGKPGLLIEFSHLDTVVWYLDRNPYWNHDCDMLKVRKNTAIELKDLSKWVGPETIEFSLENGISIFKINPEGIVSFLQKFGHVFYLQSPLSLHSSVFFTSEYLNHPPAKPQHVNAAIENAKANLSALKTVNKTLARTCHVRKQHLTHQKLNCDTVTLMAQPFVKFAKDQGLTLPEEQKKRKRNTETYEENQKKKLESVPDKEIIPNFTEDEIELLSKGLVDDQDDILPDPTDPHKRIPSENLKKRIVETIALLRSRFCDEEGKPLGYLKARVTNVPFDSETQVEPSSVEVRLFFHSTSAEKFKLYAFDNGFVKGTTLTELTFANPDIQRSSRNSTFARKATFIDCGNGVVLPLCCFTQRFMDRSSVVNGKAISNDRLNKHNDDDDVVITLLDEQ